MGLPLNIQDLLNTNDVSSLFEFNTYEQTILGYKQMKEKQILSQIERKYVYIKLLRYRKVWSLWSI